MYLVTVMANSLDRLTRLVSSTVKTQYCTGLFNYQTPQSMAPLKRARIYQITATLRESAGPIRRA